MQQVRAGRLYAQQSTPATKTRVLLLRFLPAVLLLAEPAAAAALLLERPPPLGWHVWPHKAV
jgi:hypothetical protein